MIRRMDDENIEHVAGGFEYEPYTNPETDETIGYRIIFNDPANDYGHWNNFMQDQDRAFALANSMVADRATMNPVYNLEAIREFQNFVDQQNLLNAQYHIVQPRRHRRRERLNNCQIL